MKNLTYCLVCPRECGINRNKRAGFCGAKNKLKIAKVMLADFEEPCISLKSGSGAIFFGGCNLKCVYCQNYKISAEGFGHSVSVHKLTRIMLDLQKSGAENINLITGTHFTPLIAKALKKAKPKLKVPVIFNCGGYESVESLKMLDGLVDVYLPDFKYGLNEIGEKYSRAPNYPAIAINAIKEMVRQVGAPKLGHSGKIYKGVIVRHLVLPNNLENSLAALKLLRENFKPNDILISLMAQYTPMHNAGEPPELSSAITEKEYNTVVEALNKLEFGGFTQELSSSGTNCIPKW